MASSNGGMPVNIMNAIHPTEKTSTFTPSYGWDGRSDGRPISVGVGSFVVACNGVSGEQGEHMHVTAGTQNAHPRA